MKFSQPNGPVFHYEEATNFTFGDQPHLRDPLDEKYVYVKDSTIPFAGEGLFAARDIPANINFVLYGGFLFNKEQMEIKNQKLKEEGEAKGWTEDDPMWHMQVQNDAVLTLGDAPFFK